MKGEYKLFRCCPGEVPAGQVWLKIPPGEVVFESPFEVKEFILELRRLAWQEWGRKPRKQTVKQ